MSAPPREIDVVEVTGCVVSLPGRPRVRRLRGVVCAVNPKTSEEPTLFKIWPHDAYSVARRLGVPPADAAKLWFCWRCSRVEVLRFRRSSRR